MNNRFSKVCDLCNGIIMRYEGYVFYSATIPPGSNSETGLMHICNDCTTEWINIKNFSMNLKIPSSMTIEEFSKDWNKALQWIKQANAIGIIKFVDLLLKWPKIRHGTLPKCLGLMNLSA